MSIVETQREKIRQTCKALLESGEVDTVIGYTSGEIEGVRIPFLCSKAEDTQRLEWDRRCTPNLCTYLHGRQDRVAIVAKACDVRGIIGYLVENQLERDKVHIIGVDCPGMLDAQGEASPGCGECRVKCPPLFDIRIENPEVADAGADEVPGPGSESLAENLEKFQKEMDKCILCYSCRQACYGCYCPVCFMDRGTPNWQPVTPDMGAKMVYHLGRAMHLSGRCVECGACERVCASGVDVRYIIKEVTDFIEQTYGFRAGLDADGQPVMIEYEFDDKEIGFLGGE